MYYDGVQVTDKTLMERKKLLKKAFKENERLALSRFIEREGTAFFELAKKQNLEGIVAKKKDSIYKMGIRTKEWIKIKFLKDEDFVVCGYLIKETEERSTASVILSLYNNGRLIYQGHVTLGMSRKD